MNRLILYTISSIFIITCSLFAQPPLNYSINSAAETKSTDSLSVSYVVGEPISINSNIINNIILANLIDSTAGIYAFKNHIIKIFPNPASNYIVVNVSIVDDYNIVLIDYLCKKIANIYSGIIESQDKIISLENLNIPSGSYILNINSKQINIYIGIIIL